MLSVRYGTSGLLDLHFSQKCTGVDLDNHFVTFSDATTSEDTQHAHSVNGLDVTGRSARGRGEGTASNYDLLVGADGVRSVVRAAFLQHLRRWVCL
jgi:2-polyprenyl-6-methoxyphenol hydroxylase-like FAD-dependent oxidoreductase